MYADNVVAESDGVTLKLTIDFAVNREQRELEKRHCIATVLEQIEIGGEWFNLDLIVFKPSDLAERYARQVWEANEQELPTKHCVMEARGSQLIVLVDTGVRHVALARPGEEVVVYTNRPVHVDATDARCHVRLSRMA